MPDHITTKRQPASDICRIIRQKPTRPCTRHSFDFDYPVLARRSIRAVHMRITWNCFPFFFTPERISRPDWGSRLPLLVYDTQRLAPLSTRSLYQPAPVRQAHDQSTAARQRKAHCFAPDRRLLWKLSSYYCYTWLILFRFWRLYPARLSTRRGVLQKDLLLMARTFGTAMGLFSVTPIEACGLLYTTRLLQDCGWDWTCCR